MNAVIFDLDNTLVDRHEAFVRWANGRVPEEAIGTLAALDAAGHGPKGPLFAAIASLTHREPAEVRRDFFATIGACCRLREDARALLERLRGRVPIGVLTNGGSAVQRSKITAAGIEPLVDVIVASGEVGVHKPHAKPFLAVLEKLGVGPVGSWMVGDNPTHDIDGARALGMSTVWVRTRWFATCDQADRAVDDLRSLPWP